MLHIEGSLVNVRDAGVGVRACKNQPAGPFLRQVGAVRSLLDGTPFVAFDAGIPNGELAAGIHTDRGIACKGNVAIPDVRAADAAQRAAPVALIVLDAGAVEGKG